jgi:Rps23 Pro-64 3,4-dihydroxylase Tpa1-like proline 4-hydroxylase
MKFTIVKEPLPYLIIDDIFTKNELCGIYKELDFLQPNLLGPEDTGTKFIDQKSNKGIFLENLFNPKMFNFSYIFKYFEKIYTPEITNKLLICHPSYSSIFNHTKKSTLLSYYEDSDFYIPHVDETYVTFISWFFKTPKNFTGGEFIFTDINTEVPIINNRGIIFFGFYKHEVTPVKMLSNEAGSGRFSISQFFV